MTHNDKTPRDHDEILGVLPTQRLDQQISSKNDRLNLGNTFLISLLFWSVPQPNLYEM